jgi:glycosyltransferase involved in cell wall biosynthesis
MNWLSRLTGRRTFSNREGDRRYDFTLFRSRDRPGVSALVRVRNEANKIGHCVRSILPVFDEVVIVDNASADATASMVQDIMREADPEGKIRLLSYPFRLARFGPDHDATPANSLGSAVYFTNWALSHCSFRYVCKWDGDMVLRREARHPFVQFLAGLSANGADCWTIAGQTVYRDLEGRFHLAVGEVNSEIEIFPYGFECRFTKRRHWEQLRVPSRFQVGAFEPVCFYELKYVDEDEFAHWSTTEWPSERKQREWANYHRVLRGDVHDGDFEQLPATFLDAQAG